MFSLPVVLILWKSLSAMAEEDPLQTIDWKQHQKSNHIKTWMKYVHKFISVKGLKRQYIQKDVASTLRNLSSKLDLFEIQKSQIVIITDPLLRDGPTDFYVTFPLYQLQVKPKAQFLSLFLQEVLILRWIFTLNKSLRLRILFDKVKVFGVKYLTCKYNVTVGSSRDYSHFFTFCGLYNNFNFYPYDNYLIFYLCYGDIHDFEFSTVFDTISTNLASFSDQAQQAEANLYDKYLTIMIPSANLLQRTYYVSTHKFNRVIVYIRSNEHSFFYDGPGFLSKKHQLSQRGLAVRSATFQCVIQVLVNITDENSIFTLFKMLETHTQSNLIQSDISLKFPPRVCSRISICFTKLIMESPNNTHVNISFQNFEFKGTEVFDCWYGGVTFSTWLDNRFKEIRSLCSVKDTDQANIQNVFSSSNKLLIVTYSYKKYSSLNLSLRVSYTKCKTVRISICQPERDLQNEQSIISKVGDSTPQVNANNYECVIIQLSQQSLHQSGSPANIVHKEKCFKNLKINKILPLHHIYKYEVKSYLSSNYLEAPVNRRTVEQCTFYAVSQYFIVGGKQFIRQNKSHISVFEWERRIKSPINESYFECFQDKAQDDSHTWFGLMKTQLGQNRLFYLNPTNYRPVTIQLNYLVKLPTGDNALMFGFNFLGDGSWSDVYFGPDTNTKLSTELGSFVLPVKAEPSNVKQIFSDMALMITISDERLLTNNFSVGVDIRTKEVSFYTDMIVPFNQSTTNSKTLPLRALLKYSCLYRCTNCTQPQVLRWKTTFKPRVKQKNLVIALPGEIDTVVLKSNFNISINVKLRWIENPKKEAVKISKQEHIYTWYTENEETFSGFPVLYGYNKHPVVKLSSKGDYYFVKYFDYDKNYKYYYENTTNYFRLGCPNHTHNPKLFSWNEAQKLCEGINGTLPEFISRTEQEELVNILKTSTDLFPIEAMHISLQHSSEENRYGWPSAPLSYQLWKDHQVGRNPVAFNIYHVRKNHDYQDPTTRQEVDGMEKLWRLVCLEPKRVPLCYMKENTSSLSRLKEETEYTLQPMMKSSHHCVVLVLSNLADPHWVTVSCQQKIAPAVVCLKTRKKTQNQTSASTPLNDICNETEILFDKKCFFFVWAKNNSDVEVKLDLYKKRWVSSNSSTHKIMDVIFQAIRVNILRFVVGQANAPKNATTVSYQKIWLNTATEKKRDDTYDIDGWMPFKSNLLNITNNNVFKCKNSHFISTSFLCDNYGDCHDRTEVNLDTDELFCTCGKGNNYYCKQVCTDSKCKCSPLFYKTKAGKCKTYQEQNHTQKAITKNNTFKCSNGKEISGILVNDLVSDCGTSAEDEPLYKTLSEHDDYCQNFNQLPCVEGHSKCYSFSDICAYRLNYFNHIVPCRTGSHLQECQKFQCNGQFKCPGYYCIPWSYTCDGKWDCPGGFDESTQLLCHNRSCSNMFKCKSSILCVHLKDVCDDFQDCPLNDDELLCELQFSVCLKSCTCLNFGIRCSNTSLSNEVILENLPYVSYHMTHLYSRKLISLLKNVNARFLNVSHNLISNICFNSFKANYLYALDTSYNSITSITQGCFANLDYLSIINFHANKLHTIQAGSFVNISTAFSIDLSRNNLLYLPKLAFFGLKIVTLGLGENLLTSVQRNSFLGATIHTIQTGQYKVCCIKPYLSKCNSPIPGYVSCSGLIPSDKIRICFILVASVIIICNFLSMGVSIKKVIGLDSSAKSFTNPYNVIVAAVNMEDLLFGVILATVYTVDTHFGNEYIVQEYEWKSSLSCSIMFFMTSVFCSLSTVVLSFLSICRTMVVKYPIKSRFKSRDFVIKWLAGICFAVIFLSSGLLFSLKASGRGIPTGYCLPLLDPSGSVLQIKGFIITIILLHSLSLSVILSSCLAILNQLKTTEKLLARDQSTHKKISVQLLLFTLSNILCLLPSSCAYVASLTLGKYPFELLMWTIVLVLPINSVSNPFVLLLHVPLCKMCRR